MRVILSPHLDDAALSCFTEVPEATIVTVFAGLPSDPTPSIWDRYCGFDDARAHMEARRAEDREALEPLAAEVIHLDYTEGLHREPLAGLIADLADLVPPGSHVLAPLAGGPKPHPDHRLVRDVARLLLRDGRDVTLYADVPYCCKTTRGWPKGLGGDHPNPGWINRTFRESPESSGLFLDSLWLADDIYAEKMRTLRTYHTQFDALNKRLRVKGLLDIEEVTRRETVVPLVSLTAV